MMKYNFSNENNLFYTCSLIEYISRITKNSKKYIVDKLGYDNINKIYKLADIYHNENIEKVADDFISICNIKNGTYNYKEKIPSYYDVGKIYKRLIVMIDNDDKNYVSNLIKVMTSWIVKPLDNYNSSMYYENPSYIYNCYKEGKIL